MRGLLKTYWPAAALFALGLVLACVRLDAQSLWLDEGGTWAEVTGRTGKGLGRLLLELFSPDASYPLYHVLLRGWTALAGDSEWALRFPSALAFALTLPLLWLAARELTDDRWPPLAAALLALASPYALWYAQDAKVYSLLILTCTLTLWLALRAARRGTRRDWALLALAALLGVFIHRLMILNLAGLALWLAGQSLKFKGKGLKPLALLIALLLGAGGVYGITRAVGQEVLGSGHVDAGPLLGLWYTLTAFALGRGALGGWLSIPQWLWALPALLLTALGAWRLWRAARRGDPLAALVLALLTVPLALFGVALALAPLFEARYAAVAFPAWVLIVTAGIAGDARWRSRGTLTPIAGDARSGRWGRSLTLAGDAPSGREGRSLRSRGHRRCAARGMGGTEPLAGFVPSPERVGGERSPRASTASGALTRAATILLILTVLIEAVALLQPGQGQFSGDPVKEQWREAVAETARRVQPDDLLVIQPYYVMPLWDYYAPRVTPDPLPRPLAFTDFAEGDCAVRFAGNRAAQYECYRRNYDIAYNAAAYGRKRALLLIAPEHAATIDPPISGDRFGRLGLRFAIPQKSWPCGGARFLGVELMCQSYPETFNQGGVGQVPQPQTVLPATFDNTVKLRGYTLADRPLRPGGALAITLYWTAIQRPPQNYTMFLHLCRDCSGEPDAGDDRPPLDGYFPAGETSDWRVGGQIHDERSVSLPADLPPGRYTLLLGVYPVGEPAIERRLPVSGAEKVLPGNRVVLAEVVVGGP